MAVAMRVLDATVETVDPQGTERKIPIAEFPCLPGDKPEVDTTLKTGELITAVPLPKPVAGTHIYRKVRDRSSRAYALASVVAILGKDRSGHRHPRARLSAHPGQVPRTHAGRGLTGLHRRISGTAPVDASAVEIHRPRHAIGAAALSTAASSVTPEIVEFGMNSQRTTTNNAARGPR